MVRQLANSLIKTVFLMLRLGTLIFRLLQREFKLLYDSRLFYFVSSVKLHINYILQTKCLTWYTLYL